MPQAFADVSKTTVFMNPSRHSTPTEPKTYTIRKIEATADRVRVHLSHPIPLPGVTQPRLLPQPQTLPKSEFEVSLENDVSIHSRAHRKILVLKGTFKVGERYKLIWPEDFRFYDRRYKATLTRFVVKPRPVLQYFNDRSVIEKSGRQLIHLKTNVNTLLLESVRIPPVMAPLIAWSDNFNTLSASQFRKLPERFGTLMNRLKRISRRHPEFKLLIGKFHPSRQVFHSEKGFRTIPASLPLTFRDQKTQGALEWVRITDQWTGEKISTPSKLVCITNLAITYKKSSRGLLVWVTSLNTGKPQPGVHIYGTNGKLGMYFLGTTDSLGILQLSHGRRPGLQITREVEDRFPGKGVDPGLLFKHKARFINRYIETGDFQRLLAVTKEDVSFIQVTESSEFKPEGVPIAPATNNLSTELKGHIFTDRGIYRPGDTVHFKGTVRQYQFGRIYAPREKVTFKIRNSKGVVVLNITRDLSEFGSASSELDLKSHFPLGTYTLEMTFGGNKSSRHSFLVQEFRAPRHFTRVTFAKPRPVTDATLSQPKEFPLMNIVIEGNYYTGGPVKNGQVRWKIYQTGTQFHSATDSSYKFENPIAKKVLLESSESILDAHGRLKISFPLDRSVANGEKALQVVATVVDFDGRAAFVKNTYQHQPEILIGIGKHPEKLNVEDTLNLPIILKSDSEEPFFESELTYEILRQEYHYLRKRNQQDEIYWDWSQSWRKQHSGTLPLQSGRGEFQFTPAKSGEYRLRFTLNKNGKIFQSGTSLRVGWVSPYRKTQRPYHKLEVVSDKSIYKTGETAVLTLRPQKPIVYYLVTVERENVQYHQVISSTGNNQKIDIPLTDNHSPNVYISVLGTVARGDFSLYSNSLDDEAPTFEFGTVNLSVLKQTDPLEIEIETDSQTFREEPGSEVTLNLTVKGKNGNPVEAEIAVGVVDKRILALTGFKSPELVNLSTFTLPLSTRTADLRKILVSQTPLSWIWNSKLTGGGGLDSSPSSTTLRKDFDPVAYFNPSLVTGADGRTTIRFKLPDTMTSYRVYAVAADKGNGFGNTDKTLLVTKDFYLEPGMPRFFTLGDKFNVKVSTFNKTDEDGTATLDLAATEGLALNIENKGKPLNPKDSTQFEIKGEAIHSGDMTVQFHGNFKDRVDSVQLNLPVQTGNTVDTQVLQGSFKGGSQIFFPLPHAVTAIKNEEEFLKDARIKLNLATTPFLRITEGLRYLMKYPYGCVEQTSSKILPLAGMRGLIQKGLIPGQSTADTDKFLAYGVKRLFQMQTESGGFGYWPGHAEPHVEGTLYALAALTIAKTSGFDIPDTPFRKGLDFLKDQVNRGHYETHFAFANYILALNGTLDVNQARLRMKHISNHTREDNFLWLLVGHHTGAWTHRGLSTWLQKNPPYKLILDPQGEFNARYRAQAMALLAATALAPDAPATDQAVVRLISGMDSRGIWNSTSDTGWALFALGEYYKRKGSFGGSAELEVSLGDSETQTVRVTDGSVPIEFDARTFLQNPILLFQTLSGKTIFYKARLQFPRIDYARSGHTSGWKVWKVIENLDGTDSIRVGDIVKIKVLFEAQRKNDGHRFNYLVLDDPLPAGFVAINSALKTEEEVIDSAEGERDTLYNSADDNWNFIPNHLEFRDDRVTAFKNRLYGWGTYQFVYYARAITEGEFVLPSTKVQLMYAPEVHGYTPVSLIKILGR